MLSEEAKHPVLRNTNEILRRSPAPPPQVRVAPQNDMYGCILAIEAEQSYG